ncbi:BTAD domain-containing putative transcriptional regulator [Actinomadura sp. GTD37]|uniref:AfsR/SARP family transcriptional regulator n=1 Tax=Actinomadura sp. GTD37 TaxID=1778030 RepID=UPI0035BF8DCD
MGRGSLQGRLWPDAAPAEAAKRLRQALWRVRRETGARILTVTPVHVGLAADVEVDLHRGERLARRITGAAGPDGVLSRDVPPERPALDAKDVGLLGGVLLPCWPDGDVRAAGDRWDRLRLLALERLAEHALASGDTMGAIELAEAAARVDGLAETSYRITAAAHLARADHVSAWRVYTRYRRLLGEEMRLEPSPGFRDLVERPRRRTLAS